MYNNLPVKHTPKGEFSLENLSASKILLRCYEKYSTGVFVLLWNTQRRLCSILRVGLIIYWPYFAIVTWIHKLWESKYWFWCCRKLGRVIFNTDELGWIRILDEDTGSCFGKARVKKTQPNKQKYPNKTIKEFFQRTDLYCWWKQKTQQPKMLFWKSCVIY